MKRAFSLVELSIVLVILGLLTGGILAGQSLIRAAELRSISTESQRYQTAVMAFRDKYFSLPGDMTNAEAFWNTRTNCGAGSPGSTGVCNGDGDGSLETGTAAQTAEAFGFWRHLASAELIEGNYDGITGASNALNTVPGTNIPTSKLSGAAWFAFDQNLSAGGTTTSYELDFGNHLVFGTDGAVGEFNSSPILTPEEAWNIDKKVDDSIPGTGKWIAQGWTDCTDSANDTDYTNEYDLNNDDIACAFRVVGLF